MSKVQSRKINALLEIGCEEIPARFMPGFLEDLKKKAEEKLVEGRVSFSKIETLGTCRRLVLFVENIAKKQNDLSQEVKGPPAEIAFDSSSQPTPAALGFARKQKVALKDLKVKPVGSRDYVFAKIVQKGEPTEKVLAKVFPEIISSLYQPLAMRWGNLDFKFIRPIHWMVALCGNKVVSFFLAGVESGGVTHGHRHLKTGSKSSKLKSAELSLYKNLMQKLGVVVDPEERKKLIRKQVEGLAKKVGAAALVEQDLLAEVTFLVENPIAYLGEFDEKFLGLPQEVLITSMKKNQKYFSLTDKSGQLINKFVVITDGCSHKEVVGGNEKVLGARLSDAKFFFEEDKKEPLKLRAVDLEKVAFFDKLGMISNKVERMAKLSEWVGKRLKLNAEQIKVARRIAELSKADLTTMMVYEFPTLQGIMGREYAILSGEDPRVALGIFEHYLPRHAADLLPESLCGMCVAICDRIDSLVGCFSIGAIPSGSADPFSLRRAANGIIRIVVEKKLDILLDELIEHSYKLYQPVFLAYLFEQGETGYQDFAKIRGQILDFMAKRLKPVLLDLGIRYDIVDAALGDFNDILDTVEKAKILNNHVNEKWFPGIVASADRISRIATDVVREEVIKADLEEKEEKDLFDLYMKVNWEVGEAINAEDWGEALRSLAELTDPIEKFFDKVLVMHKEERLKLNRLALLGALEKVYLEVADFRKVVLPG
ncbi:MAG: glycine--tRNA ligase subunit beta [Candidatus Saganbacteria bacterium]|nr:glycine--tRNA ligase subunit beta [Candidatus Saganbacteria bacterium]